MFKDDDDDDHYPCRKRGKNPRKKYDDGITLIVNDSDDDHYIKEFNDRKEYNRDEN